MKYMSLKAPKKSLFAFLFLLSFIPVTAQDNRGQLPSILANTYISVSTGYIGYHFTNRQMEQGFQAASVHIPHPAMRITFGIHRFNKFLSAQISYMRPVNWVLYKNVNGDLYNHSVWMNILALSLKPVVPLSGKLSAYGEAGLVNVTRNGFRVGNSIAVKSAEYISLLLGAGIQYRLGGNWDLVLSSGWSPANRSVQQPSTLVFSAGAIYNTHPLSARQVERNSKSPFIFPHHLLQVGYTSSSVGFGINKFFADGAIPVFWSGDVKIGRGVLLNYQQNVYHNRKVFSLDWGASMGYWESRKNNESFFTMSVYPLFRFTAIRSNPADIYFVYSLAGPSFISKVVIDGDNTGKNFTFQDFMGIGFYAGKARNVNAEVKIGHYSDGNLFPENNGIDFPLAFNVGYAF